MDIKLIVIGKIKENYISMAIEEYLKRIKPMANLQIIELKEWTTNEDHKNLFEEGKLIQKCLNSQDYIITLEIEGSELSSIELSEMISKHYLYSNKTLTFIIGSSCGLDKEIKKISDFKLSFSKMTFPHQLMRVIFLEQVYRALMIIDNRNYHK